MTSIIVLFWFILMEFLHSISFCRIVEGDGVTGLYPQTDRHHPKGASVVCGFFRHFLFEWWPWWWSSSRLHGNPSATLHSWQNNSVTNNIGSIYHPQEIFITAWRKVSVWWWQWAPMQLTCVCVTCAARGGFHRWRSCLLSFPYHQSVSRLTMVMMMLVVGWLVAHLFGLCVGSSICWLQIC